MQKKKKTLLWSFYHEDLGPDLKSFLFGSMHVKDYRAFAGESMLLEKIAICDLFAAEFDLDSVPTDFKFENLHSSENFSLFNCMSQKRYNKMYSIFKKSCNIVLDDYNQLPPLLLINIINEAIFTSVQPLALDAFLWNEAKKLGLEMTGIESFEDQINCFQKIPVSYQLTVLNKISQNISKYRKSLFNLLDLYESGDIHQLYLKTKQSLGKQKKNLLYNRNKTMLLKILEHSRNKSSFFCLGAAHLSGLRGILHGLKDNQVRLSPIRLEKSN